MGFVTTTERPELTAVAEYRLTVDADGRITSARPIERAPTCLVWYWDYGTVPVGIVGIQIDLDKPQRCFVQHVENDPKPNGEHCMRPAGETGTIDFSKVDVEPFVSEPSNVTVDPNDPMTKIRHWEDLMNGAL